LPANPAAATIVAEFGSAGNNVVDAMLVFQALVEGNGTNPFRLAPLPSDMPEQDPATTPPAMFSNPLDSGLLSPEPVPVA